jgi:hypothetical protein
VGQLEVPPARQGGRNDLRPLDAHPEAAAGGRRADRHRGLAGGRPYRRRGPVRRRRGGGERTAQCAGGPSSRRRRHAGRPGADLKLGAGVPKAPRPTPCSLHCRGRFPTAPRRTCSPSRRGGGPRARRKDWRGPAPAPAPPAGELGSRSRRSGSRPTSSRGLGPAPSPSGRKRFGIRSPGRQAQSRHQAPSPPLGLSRSRGPLPNPPPEGGRGATRAGPGPRCIR